MGIESITTTLQQVTTRLEALETKQIQPISKPKSASKPAKDKKPTTPTDEPKLQAQALRGSATLDQIPQHPETTSTLAKRWQMTAKTLTRQRQRYEGRPDGFFTYSLEKEEGRFGWVYDPPNQFFYAALEPPTSLNLNASSEPQLSLNSGKLAKRFGIGSSTIRNAKRTKSPEEFANFSQQHDPDGLAWRFNQETKHYETLH